MKSADRPLDEDIYRACVTWNLPVLRSYTREDVQEFIQTLQLSPAAFADQEGSVAPKHSSPLKRATLGLRAEMNGHAEEARGLYRHVARQPGARGLLGSLLLAWMQDATPSDFARVERRLEGFSGRGSHDVIARCHCKMTMWAMDQGWRDIAHHHFRQARRYAGRDLDAELGALAHWFGEDRVITFGRRRGEMTSLRWIVEFAEHAAQRAIEERFKESFRSPWTRTWTFGSPSVEGHEIQVADLQASWAGALWLAPRIQRQHAAQILANSRAEDDVARAIGLWVRGGGQDIGRLLDAYEGNLTDTSIEELLVRQLHLGRSVNSPRAWLETCHALWAELPETVLLDIVGEYSGPPAEVEPRDDEGLRLSLMARLITRSEAAARVAANMDETDLALALRTLPPGLVREVEPSLLERALDGVIKADANDSEWASLGWATLSLAWASLPETARERLREPLAELVPEDAMAEVAATTPRLLSASDIDRALITTLQRVRQSLDDSKKGRFVNWSTEPAIALARLALAVGERRPEVLEVLVATANSLSVMPSQRQAALAALLFLAREGAVTPESSVVLAYDALDISAGVSTLTGDVEGADQRVEDVQRHALRATLQYDSRSEGQFLAASRDPSTRVRNIAVNAVQWLVTQGRSASAFDATLLGALYDPHPLVQATAVSSLWRGSFVSEVLREAAHDRVLELWPTAHVDVRLAIASEVATLAFQDGHRERLQGLALSDRSFLVRSEAARPSAGLT